MEVKNRRPIKTRSRSWAGTLARGLSQAGLSPNQISVLGIFMAVLGAGAFILAGRSTALPRVGWMLAAAACIQLRLLCNMLDGLVAVECGKKSALGDLFNEVPDRIEDVLFLLSAGYATGGVWGPMLGWFCALAAVGTAYVRLLGGSLGMTQDFCGPFAKPQRMFFLTVGALGSALESVGTRTTNVLPVVLILIAAGTWVTVIRRLVRLARTMGSR